MPGKEADRLSKKVPLPEPERTEAGTFARATTEKVALKKNYNQAAAENQRIMQ
jgi:hypothetical protein